jgi:hypothetical protein
MNCTGPMGLFSATCEELLRTPIQDRAYPAEQWGFAFFLTIALEAPIYWLGLRTKLSLRRIAAVILILNLLTHPAVWYLWPRWAFRAGWDFRTYALACEIFAPALEAFTLILGFKIPPGRAVVTSILANLCSWWIGAWIQS